MRIFYSDKPDEDGNREVIRVLRDADIFWDTTELVVPHRTMDVPEILENRDQCHDVFGNWRFEDEQGRKKHVIDALGKVAERPDWKRYEEPPPERLRRG